MEILALARREDPRANWAPLLCGCKRPITITMAVFFLLLSLLFVRSSFGDSSFSLNVGLVDPSGTVSSPNVVADGSPKAPSQWDPVPFSTLSTYSSPKVTFALWINDLPDAKTSYPINVHTTFTAPLGGDSTNFANCVSPPKVDVSSGTIEKLTNPTVNASALRITFDPQQGCTQPGQSQVYFTITTPGQTDPLAQLWFVTTTGNPLNIGMSLGSSEITTQGVVSDNWNPIHLKDGNESELYSVNSGVKDIVFYLHIPAARAQTGTNPLVLGNADGVTLKGSEDTRQSVSCTAKGIAKACQANVRPIKPTPAPNGGVWESQRTIDAGFDFSLHIDYVCETNGFVDLLVEIPLESGFAPVSFAWRKACERSPGLAIATNVAAVLADPDVAQDGLIRPRWDARNTTVVDRDGDANDKVLTQREFYFWVNPAGTNVKAAVFKSTNYTSNPHPSHGATNLICKPKPKWEIAKNFEPSTSTCSNGNVCEWKPLTTVVNDAPSEPIQPNTAPLRAVFDYSHCSGQGTVLLSFEMTFGEFDLIRGPWFVVVFV